MIDRMQRIKGNLQEFAAKFKPRIDWHEPDEQDIDAIITGSHLDNAFGIDQLGVKSEWQEYVVHLTVDGSVEFSINLADLLAIAAS